MDTSGGAAVASVDRVYNYPSNNDSLRKVDAGVQYRSPKRSRAFVAAYASPRATQCTRAAYTAQLRRFFRRYVHRYPRLRLRDVTVREWRGLPLWLTRALGRPAQGYRTTVNVSGIEHIRGIIFAYQEAADPHLVYDVAVLQVNMLPKQIVLRVIRATG
jgi:hypothetical protein